MRLKTRSIESYLSVYDRLSIEDVVIKPTGQAARLYSSKQSGKRPEKVLPVQLTINKEIQSIVTLQLYKSREVASQGRIQLWPRRCASLYSPCDLNKLLGARENACEMRWYQVRTFPESFEGPKFPIPILIFSLQENSNRNRGLLGIAFEWQAFRVLFDVSLVAQLKFKNYSSHLADLKK
jgi:hypothetical protein